MNAVSKELADDFVEIGQSGRRYSKEDVLSSLPALIAAEYVVHDFEAREIGKDTFLIHYRLEMKRDQNGPPTYSLRSSIWQRRPPGWRVIFHQGTPLPVNLSGAENSPHLAD